MARESTGELKRVKYILFDMDGTLVDTVDLIIHTFQVTLDELGLPPLGEQEIISQIGRPLFRQVQDLYPDRAEEVFELYQRIYPRYHDAMAKDYPGVRESLAELFRRGYRLAVVTSKRTNSTLADLAFFDLEPFFEVVITAQDTEQHKPHPEPVLLALKRLGAPAGEATFIGDSPHDLKSGRAAGVLAGAVEWGPYPREKLEIEKPDYWVRKPLALLDLFPGV